MYTGAIDSFGNGTFSVKRQLAGTWASGIYTAGGQSMISVTGCVQPLSGSDLKNLAEGQHADDMRVIFTKTEMKNRTPTTEPDEITFSGEQWEVIKVERWDAFDQVYYKATVARRVTP